MRNVTLTGHRAQTLLLGGALALTAGCSAVQSNVRGGFACGAPGGTCAPSTTIDDAAVSAIHRSERAQASARDKADGPDLVLADDAAPEEDAILVKALPVSRRNPSADRGPPPGPALKVVYPAYQDRNGEIHPRRLAYALVDSSAWVGALRGRGHTGDSANPPMPLDGLLGAALHAPPFGALEFVREDGNVPANRPSDLGEGQVADVAPVVSPAAAGSRPAVSSPGTGNAGGKPDTTVGGKVVNPTAQIEAEVSAMLARRKPASAGTFSGKVE